jgi:hypothetical protein
MLKGNGGTSSGTRPRRSSGPWRTVVDWLGNGGDRASQDGRDGGGGAAERGEPYGDGDESRGPPEHRRIRRPVGKTDVTTGRTNQVGIRSGEHGRGQAHAQHEARGVDGAGGGRRRRPELTNSAAGVGEESTSLSVK